jgi:hypothetical protein
VKVMRKILLTAVALVMVAGLAAPSFAATLLITYPITVTLAADPIDLSGVNAPVSFGLVGLSQTVYSNQTQGQPRSTIVNLGFARVDYELDAAVVASGAGPAWTLGAAAGADTCVLRAIATAAVLETEAPTSGLLLAAAHFEANDDLDNAVGYQVCSDTVFASDAWIGNTMVVKAYDVVSGLPNSSRSFRYQLQTPTSSTDVVGMTFNITISAVVG